ncbi:MAG TPA: isochorismatase [Actinobacteria bacterium]|nr:isochorismatase [Actinomycetota bacterium]HCK79046.1 isochorismatase [Actinomycetota bacterium]
MATDHGDVTANYKGAFDGSLDFGAHPVLLLVDVCRAYIDPESPLYAGVEDSAASMRRVLAAARATGIPVVWTRVEYEPGGANGGYFYQKVPALKAFEAGNPLGDWVDGLEPQPGELVVTKQYPSAFVGTDLADTLHSQGIDTVIITGWSTSGCIRATGVDTVSMGFIPIVIRDAVGDRHPGPHEANLFDLQAKYAEVVSEEAVLDYLAQRRTA